jgi:autotransporter-associated beta strand protein
VPGGGAGVQFFLGLSSAGNAKITNEGVAFADARGGYTMFMNNTTAANATIESFGSAVPESSPFVSVSFTSFNDGTSAGNSTIIAHGGTAAGAPGAWTTITDVSTAGSATLIADGGVGTDPTNLSDSGPGGHIYFGGTATGGTSTVKIYDKGMLDISQHDLAGVTIGSLEGTGRVWMGGVPLTIGSNDKSTTFSGTLKGNLSPSLTKVGAGTLTLTGSINLGGGLVVRGGAVQGDGAVNTPVTVERGATFGGRGMITGALSNAGTVTPGDLAGNSTAVLNVAGDYVQTPEGKLRIEIGGTAAGSGYDRVLLAGSMTLGGILELRQLDSFKPSADDTFVFLTSPLPRTGTFATITGVTAPIAPSGLSFAVTYFSNNVRVTAALPGDVDLDDEVGPGDFNLLASNFGKTGQTWSTGDLDGDGLVGPADFNLLASSFGRSVYGDGAFITEADRAALQSFANVPEPAGVIVAAAWTGIVMTRRRRARR